MDVYVIEDPDTIEIQSTELERNVCDILGDTACEAVNLAGMFKCCGTHDEGISDVPFLQDDYLRVSIAVSAPCKKLRRGNGCILALLSSGEMTSLETAASSTMPTPTSTSLTPICLIKSSRSSITSSSPRHPSLPRQASNSTPQWLISRESHLNLGERLLRLIDRGDNLWHDAYDCSTQEDIMLRIIPEVLPADNPQQSASCSHVGLHGNHPCRRCEFGGTELERETDEGYETHFSVSMRPSLGHISHR